MIYSPGAWRLDACVPDLSGLNFIKLDISLSKPAGLPFGKEAFAQARKSDFSVMHKSCTISSRQTIQKFGQDAFSNHGVIAILPWSCICYELALELTSVSCAYPQL